jgi:membrane associated rhomboid family serine protease
MGNACYRHPERVSYILCQRCGRTLCPECSTQASVGVHCPSCVGEARKAAPRRASRFSANRNSGSRPVVTISLVIITVIVFGLQYVSRDLVTSYLLYQPILTVFMPWTMITSLFVHSGIFHIGLNMLALSLFGPSIEALIGRLRFLSLYLLSGFGGSVAVLWLGQGNPVLGASGAIFGLLGSYFIIQRKLGGNTVQLLVVIGLNLAMGFFIPGIAWQAHVGGVVVGAIIAVILVQTRHRNQRAVQALLLIVVFAALVMATVVRVL